MTNLPYNIDDVLIKQGVGVSNQHLKQIYEKLIENDKSLDPEKQNIPQIWENRWYNAPENKSLYYKKGSAVWLNTENESDFIKNKEKDIKGYISKDMELSKKLDMLSSDQYSQERFEIYRKIVNGTYDAKHSSPLYFIGDINKPAQIRISLSDDNNTTPDNDNYWTDMFDTTSEEDINISVLNQFDECSKSRLEQHMKEYHMYNSIKKDDGREYTPDFSDIANEYLLSDMSNVVTNHKFVSHGWYKNELSGFDYVQNTIIKKFGNNSVKWYRLWNSGMLEHGGTISVKNPGASKDSMTDNLYIVNLNWSDTGIDVPVYDYYTIDDFYQDSLYYTSGISSQKQIINTDIGQDIRYTVSVTPYSNNILDPYQDSVQIDTCFYKNNSFGIILNQNDIDYCSYYARGFIRI